MPRLADLALKHPCWAALLLGAGSALGFEPLALWPLTLLGLAGLIALIGQAPTRRAALLLGWSFGLGQFALGLNWIATAFTFQAALPAWLGWIAVMLIGCFLAIYPALAVLAAWHARARPLALVLALAGAWALTEWLRGWLFTGFPWNPLGAVLLGPFEQPGAARLLPWLGTYALAALTVLFAGMWLTGLTKFRSDRRMLMLLALPLIAQFWPVSGQPAKLGNVPYVLVQPQIPQDELNDPAHFEDNYARLAQLVPPALAGSKALILWPESGVSDYLRSGYPTAYYAETFAANPAQARARLGRLIGPARLLLTGTVDLEMRDGRSAGARNAITAVDGAGQLRASYAKAHLVPFGEYLPLRALLTPLGLNRFVPGDTDFWPGPGVQTIDLGTYGKTGMLICYEVIFPGHVADAAHRPDYLFNPSNDGWYGSWGPPQHLAQARMRALEEGLPMLRATTTGISAVIAPDGVVLQSVPLRAAGVLLGRIPQALPPTLFARAGNGLSLGWAALLLALSLVALRRARA